MTHLTRTESYVAPDGVTLVGDRGGPPDAPCVVLLHGGGQTRHSWSMAMQRLLVDGLQVINFDARGHGDSDWSPNGAYSLPDRACDLQTITATLTTPFVLVGASLGGATAVQAIHDGLRPAGLVLVDIVPEPEAAGVDRIVNFMAGNQHGFASIDEVVEAVAAYNPNRRKSSSPDGLMKNLRRRDDGRLYWHWDPRILDMGNEEHHLAIRQAADSLTDLPDLPVMLVRGLTSDVVGDDGVEALRRRVPHLQVLDVDGAGHMVAGDRNDTFADGVIAFAQRVFEVPGMVTARPE